MTIVQGDNNRVIPFNTNLNLKGSTVKVTVKRGGEFFEKTATIIDEETGKCEFTLYSSELTVGGIVYEYQWTAVFEDGQKISDRPVEFYVHEKQTGVAPQTGADPGTINIKVDGGEF